MSNQTTCVVDGCERSATGEVALWGDAEASLCEEHAAAFRAQPTDWDGTLTDDGSTVSRLWRREGVGEAS